MKQIIFKQSVSQRIYDNYIKRINRTVGTLSKTDREDVLKEFNSHIYEGINRIEKKAEADALLDVLDRLGPPEETLKPLIAGKKLEQATKTFNPVHILQALTLNITNGFIYIIFAILYVLLLGGIILIYVKIANPEEVGLYFSEGKFLALGEFRIGTENNVEEVLGKWFIPVIFTSMILIYVILTFFLGLKRRINKKLWQKYF